jgi:aspartate/methionine/tyrosine aminotransferase
MNINYLSWFKDLEVRLQNVPGAHFLMSSSVCEPTDVLKKHLDKFLQSDLSAILSVPNGWGYPALEENIARRYGVLSENVAATNGVSNAIYLLCRLLLSGGNHVVIESPAYEPLVASPDFIGCGISFLKRRPPDYSVDPDDLKAVVKPNTKLVILSNLHNPSSALLPDDLLVELAGEARKISSDIKIVVDEVYHDFVSRSVLPAATLDDCFISLNSLTKAYGLGSLHTGWIIAEPEIVKNIKRLQTLIEGSGAKLLEAFVSVIIANLDEYWERSASVMSENRKLLHNYLKPFFDSGIFTGRIPERGCIYFPRVNGVDNTDELVEDLAEKHSVYIVPGRFFGEPGSIRIGFGAESRKLEQSLGVFVRAVNSI